MTLRELTIGVILIIALTVNPAVDNQAGDTESPVDKPLWTTL